MLESSRRSFMSNASDKIRELHARQARVLDLAREEMSELGRDLFDLSREYESAGEELFFFFQAEDGIRDIGVTGVQTCALPISTTGPDCLSLRLTWFSIREAARIRSISRASPVS